MARPREFSPDEALEQAMQAFWSNGYEATSLAELTRVMGISKSSFYQTFGSKHELYLAAIDRYGETVVAPTVGLLESENWAAGTIATVFERVIDAALAEDNRRGCLVCNAAVEVAPRDAAAALRVGACLARFETAFHRAVTRGQEAGEIPPEREARALARFLTASLQGLLVLAKAKADRDALNDVARIALGTIV